MTKGFFLALHIVHTIIFVPSSKTILSDENKNNYEEEKISNKCKHYNKPGLGVDWGFFFLL